MIYEMDKDDSEMDRLFVCIIHVQANPSAP